MLYFCRNLSYNDINKVTQGGTDMNEKKIVRAVVVGGGAIAQRRHLPEYAANPNAEVAGIESLCFP